ncbi:MAG: cytochrome c1 [Pseudomonadota bacterium]|nr:cytochrome c1 [Pseudomonadota bacterium]
MFKLFIKFCVKDLQIKSVMFSVILCLFYSTSIFAASANTIIQTAENDVANIASLQRGARNFVNYCMACHSIKYVRFNKLQEALELTEDQVKNNLMFAADKIDENITNAMSINDAEKWFGQAPPDLSLISRSRGTDWVYTFLKSFYRDDRSSSGVNNLMLPNTSMPHVLWELQGLQNAKFASTIRDEKIINNFANPDEFQKFEFEYSGTLTPSEYDQFVVDIVNFLDWAGTPERLERQSLGIWVILFLFVFLMFAYLLKIEIWKDLD